MQSKPFALKSLVAAMLLCGAVSASAQITVYTDRNAFLAAVGGYGVDTYDDLDIDLYDSPFARSRRLQLHRHRPERPVRRG